MRGCESVSGHSLAKGEHQAVGIGKDGCRMGDIKDFLIAESLISQWLDIGCIDVIGIEREFGRELHHCAFPIGNWRIRAFIQYLLDD